MIWEGRIIVIDLFIGGGEECGGGRVRSGRVGGGGVGGGGVFGSKLLSSTVEGLGDRLNLRK